MSKSIEIRRRRDLPLNRLPLVRDGVTVVWLDDSSKPPGKNIELHSRKYFTFLCYTKVSKLIKYVKKATAHEYIIVVLNELDLNSFRNVLIRLEKCRTVRIILTVACKNEEFDFLLSLTSTSATIRVYRDQHSMLIQLHQYVENTGEQFGDDSPFSICSDKERSLRDVRRELGTFLWTYSYFLILAAMDYNSDDAKKEFLKECRRIYCGNAMELGKINEFAETYQSCDAILWYTKSCFVHRLVNRVLRYENALALYTIRYFIVDMHMSLTHLAAAQTSKPTRVYRGTRMARDEVEQLTSDSLVMANGFLSSSVHIEVAQQFLGIDSTTGMSPSRRRADRLQFVLFEITINSNFQDIIAADVSSLSSFSDENEFIFGLCSTFTITKVSYDEQHFVWMIEMITSSEISQQKREYQAYIQDCLQDTHPIFFYGNIMSDMRGSYSQTLTYLIKFLRELPAQHTHRPILYYNLGRIYRFLGKYDRALGYLRCAELIQRRFLPRDPYAYGSTLAALGILFSELDEPARAVQYFERAITIHKTILPGNHREMPFHVNRLAYAYWQTGRYAHGLELVNGVQFSSNCRLPSEHPTVAQTLHLKGLLHHALGNYEPAFKYYCEALKAREILLGKDHPYVARTCYHLSLLHEERGEYYPALQQAKRAWNIQMSKYPKAHPEGKLTNDLLCRLQTKVDVSSSSEQQDLMELHLDS